MSPTTIRVRVTGLVCITGIGQFCTTHPKESCCRPIYADAADGDKDTALASGGQAPTGRVSLCWGEVRGEGQVSSVRRTAC